MKYWSFSYFWSIFFLILAAMCNFETQIPVCQNQRSCAERDHRLPQLLLHVLLHSWPGQRLGPQPSYSSGMGNSLWTRMSNHGVTNLCPHPLAGPWWFLQRISEAVSSVCKVPLLCPGSRGSQRKGTSLSYSLAVALLFGQPERAEMESSVPLRKLGPGRSLADFKRSV